MTTAHPVMSRAWLKGRAWLLGGAWLCLTCMLGTHAQTSRNYTTVTFSDGRQLRGEVTHIPGAASTSSVARFLGVQYGASPTGARRYSQPELEPSWSGLRDALTFGPRCVQSLSDWDDQSENCLNLNIFSPSLNSSNPVMVWFHGGGWRVGSSSDDIFDGTSLASRGVVVVTVNYRLGPLGFLTTGDDVMPGNYGMLDQVLALRWVRDNIRSFGGDPNSVTIFGESAGAASCSLHVLSPLSRGLFHRAIMESGSSFNLWGTERPGSAAKLDNLTRQIGERVGCRYITSESFLACLRNVSARNLLEATLSLRAQLRIEIPLTPRVERRFGFLPDYPKRLLESGSFNRVDTLRGYNSGEYSYFINDPENDGLTRQEFATSFERFFSKYPVQGHAHDFLVQFIGANYLGNNTNPITIRSNLVTAFADTGFGLGSILELQKMLEHGGASNSHYVYEADYQTSLSNHPAWMGVLHGGELSLVFMNTSPIPSFFQSPTDRAVGEKVQALWSNFARTGNPVATRVAENGGEVRWGRYTLAGPTVLRIDARSSEISFPRPESLRAYDQFLNILQVNNPTVPGTTSATSLPQGTVQTGG
ncbi:hypothetical protein BsWGS_14497 [Bradybaena similaris]